MVPRWFKTVPPVFTSLPFPKVGKIHHRGHQISDGSATVPDGSTSVYITSVCQSGQNPPYGFRPYAGLDASKQPADIPDCLPHETAVAWARGYMKKHPFDRRKGLDGMSEQLTQLLEEASAHINASYDVEKLCRGEFMQRMRALSERKGDRLNY